MRNLFSPISIQKGTPDEFLSWGYSLRYFFPSLGIDPLSKSYPILDFFNSIFLVDSFSLKTFEDYPLAIANYFLKSGYANPSTYAYKSIQLLNETLEQDRQTSLFKVFNSHTNYFLKEAEGHHPATHIFYGLTNIFSSHAYTEELSDLLVLSYSYAKTLTFNIKNSDLIVEDYHHEMYHKEDDKDRKDTPKGTSPRIFNDSLYRMKKKNNGQLPLPTFISSRPFDSCLDIEIVSNLLRSTDPSKNPFIALIDASSYTYKKEFSLEKFLSSFHAISLNRMHIELKGINSYRLYSQNQYVLERLTNANFIFSIYELEHHIRDICENPQKYITSNRIRIGQLNEINNIDPELLDEIKNWIYFPLLTTRLRIIAYIYKETPRILLLGKPYLAIIKELLKTIRLYHLHVLLPLLIQSFIYIATFLELINIPSLKKSEVGSEKYVSSIKELQTQLFKSSLLPFIKIFKKINIDKNLKEYLSSAKGRLTYFSLQKKEVNQKDKKKSNAKSQTFLRPEMYLSFLEISEHKDISVYDPQELNSLSKKLYTKFQHLANQYTPDNINHSPFQKELNNPSYAQYIAIIFNSMREEELYIPQYAEYNR